MNLLRWASFASRPLTIAEVSEALIVADEEFNEDVIFENILEEFDQNYIDKEIVGLCGSLLEVPRTNPDEPIALGTIHLTHFSVKGFLLATSARAELCDIRIEISRHRTLNNHPAIACLRYLRCKCVYRTLTSSEATRSLLDYVARSWHLHISASGEKYYETISEVNKFYEPGTQSWDFWNSYFQKGWQPPSFITNNKETGHPSRYYYAAWFGLRPTIEYLYTKTPETLNSVGGLYGTALQAACVVGNAAHSRRGAETPRR